MKSLPPKSTTIPGLLSEMALRFSNNEAIKADGKTLTYLELFETAKRCAKSFLSIGVKPKDHVAILMGNKIEWVCAFLGLQMIGATAVALNTWSTPKELAYTLTHSEVKYLIGVESFKKSNYFELISKLIDAKELNQLIATIWIFDETKNLNDPLPRNFLNWENFLNRFDSITESQLDELSTNVKPSDVAVLLYTSGSTAAPKGILLQHQNWIENAWNIGERQHIQSKDRLWLAVSLFWSFGCVNALPNMLTHGACIVLQEHFDAEVALNLIEKEKCSVVYGTPNMIQALLEHPDRTSHDLTSLRTGAMIGSPEQIQWAVQLGAKQICNIYGLSETYGNCAVIDANEELEIRLHSVGKPLPGVELKICDIETGVRLSSNQVGEIRVKGPLFSSYFKDPEKTNESYDEEKFFKTGDLGEVDKEGRLYYKGRLKEMVKSGGINIAPIEVEEVLMRHPKVRTAFVIGIKDKQLDEKLAAFLVLKEEVNLELDEIKSFCKEEMAAYKVPSIFKIIKDNELPLTTTGKIQKMKLNQLLI
jgi:fatty-acyl-CoA synthase